MIGDLRRREPDRVRVERSGEAAVGRHQDDQPRAALAPREQRVLVTAEHDGEVGEDLVDLRAVRAAPASVASWARFSLDAATNCIARVICLMFATAR